MSVRVTAAWLLLSESLSFGGTLSFEPGVTGCALACLVAWRLLVLAGQAAAAATAQSAWSLRALLAAGEAHH